MKIDWKVVASSPGYKSLKASYVRDLTRGNRSKQELLRKFRWVIDRAKHYAHHKGTFLQDVLNHWESKRDYWWLNYYQESNQPKFHSGSIKRRKNLKTYYSHLSGKDRFHVIRDERQRYARFLRNRVQGKKPRHTLRVKRR